MFCGNCGKKIQEDFKICPYCGKAISHSTSSVPGDLTAPAAPVQAAANVTARQTAPVTPVQAAANVTSEQTAPVAPVQTAAKVTAGTPQGYYQQNVQSGYAYSAPVNVKKKTHPLSVILLVVGLLCIAGAAVLVFMNRGLFYEKSNVEEITEDSVLPCSFDVWFSGSENMERTTKYSLSNESEQKMLHDLNKYIKSVTNKSVEIDSSVFVVPPTKITINEDGWSEFIILSQHDEMSVLFNVVLNRSLYDLQTNYNYNYSVSSYDNNLERFFFLSYYSDGDVQFSPNGMYIMAEFDKNGRSQPFAIVDMDNLLKQIGVSPREMARLLN